MVLQFNFGCKNGCIISQAEWMAGMQKVNARDVAALKARLPALCREVDGEPLAATLPAFTKFWTYCYVNNLTGSAKQLPLADVQFLTATLMAPRARRFPWVELWAAFLASRDPKTVVTRDTWSQLPDLATKAQRPDLADFVAQGHWPVLFDEFDEWARAKRAEGGGGGGGGV